MNTSLLGVTAPAEECADQKCPFHGQVKVKPELFRGIVVKRDLNRSATIEWFRPYSVPKYERHELRRSRLRVHNPRCLNAAVGDEVLVARTRPLSKTIHHTILKIESKHKRIIAALPELSESSESSRLQASGHKKKTMADKEKLEEGVHHESAEM